MDEKVYVVTDDGADGTIAREISRAGSDTQRALAGWALTSGVPVGGPGTGGGAVVVGASPFKVTDLGDGTGELEIVAPGAQIIDNGDGTIDLVIGGDE